MSVKCCSSDASFPGNVTHPNVAVGTAMKKIHEGSVDLLASSVDAAVAFGAIPLNIRDSCRFVFDKSHASAFFLDGSDQFL